MEDPSIPSPHIYYCCTAHSASHHSALCNYLVAETVQQLNWLANASFKMYTFAEHSHAEERVSTTRNYPKMFTFHKKWLSFLCRPIFHLCKQLLLRIAYCLFTTGMESKCISCLRRSLLSMKYFFLQFLPSLAEMK